MDCRFSEEELSAFVDGEVERAKAAAIETHLHQCRRCQAAVERIHSLRNVLGVPREVEPSLRMRQALARSLALSDPNPHFSCARAQIAISASLDGELSAEQAQWLQSHLQQCAACASEKTTLQVLSQVLQGLPEVAPPLGLERSVRIAIERQRSGLVPRWLLEGVRGLRLAPGLAPVAAALALLIGFWAGRQFPAFVPQPSPMLGVVSAPEPTPTTANTGVVRIVPAEKSIRTIARKPRPRFLVAYHQKEKHSIVRRSAPPSKPALYQAASLSSSSEDASADSTLATASTAEVAPPTPPEEPPAPTVTVADAEATPAHDEAAVKPSAEPIRVALEDLQAATQPQQATDRHVQLWRMGQRDDLELAAAALTGKTLFRGPQRTVLVMKFQ